MITSTSKAAPWQDAADSARAELGEILAARREFESLFPSILAAEQYESQALSIGRSFLPECAQAVLDGGDSTVEYWQWLAGQVRQAAE